MKKIISSILLLCIVLTLAACGKVEITMQDVYNAAQVETMLKNHQSVYIRNALDGELWRETYLTKDYAYDYIPDEESDWAEFMTDDACYCYMGGGYLRYLPISPNGVSDFASYRAEHYAAVILGVDVLDDTIESVTQKDDRITVKSVCGQEVLAELGVASAKFEYVLDAKTREIISVISDYTYDDETTFGSVTEVTCDTEEPEMVKTFLKYDNQTENLRNITVVSNPGTENEKIESVRVPKGLIIGFRYDEDDVSEFHLYTDAACTENYDPYGDTDSDLTIYVKWTE
jgi:hypothetical protein